MDKALGLVGILVFIAAVLVVAAAVTFAVIKVDAVVRRRRGAEPL